MEFRVGVGERRIRGQGSVRRGQGLGVGVHSVYSVYSVVHINHELHIRGSSDAQRADTKLWSFILHQLFKQHNRLQSAARVDVSSYPHPMRKRVYTTFHSSNLATGSKNVASFYSPALTLIQLCSPLHIDCHAATRIGLLSG